ncbi:hypothetical protein MGN01_02910 [Methylobacterium gnaphalii]|uniref:Uncharacterized protein n=1 Tax=Methylobacterium gnaphalii TaxID=1010610 RepID=A0A512JER9_9HYPH|nr:hypothetical protein MGN01_02910 [Methylobacterium gnaphalii]
MSRRDGRGTPLARLIAASTRAVTMTRAATKARGSACGATNRAVTNPVAQITTNRLGIRVVGSATDVLGMIQGLEHVCGQ